MSDQHVQALLVKSEETQVAWLPSEFAVVGKWLKIQDEDGWRVEEIYAEAPSMDVHRRSHEHFFWRRVKRGGSTGEAYCDCEVGCFG